MNARQGQGQTGNYFFHSSESLSNTNSFHCNGYTKIFFESKTMRGQHPYVQHSSNNKSELDGIVQMKYLDQSSQSISTGKPTASFSEGLIVKGCHCLIFTAATHIIL